MFDTLELQYLNKLPEGKVGDFASPKPFQVSVKVQRLGGDKVKPSTKVRGKFPLPIFALVGNRFPIQPCEVSDTPPPIVRTFDFARKTFVEFAKFGQGVFQELWRLYLLARVQRQEGIFQGRSLPLHFHP